MKNEIKGVTHWEAGPAEFSSLPSKLLSVFMHKLVPSRAESELEVMFAYCSSCIGIARVLPAFSPHQGLHSAVSEDSSHVCLAVKLPVGLILMSWNR